MQTEGCPWFLLRHKPRETEAPEIGAKVGFKAGERSSAVAVTEPCLKISFRVSAWIFGPKREQTIETTSSRFEMRRGRSPEEGCP